MAAKSTVISINCKYSDTFNYPGDKPKGKTIGELGTVPGYLTSVQYVLFRIDRDSV
jgi:hypothetical protein